MCQGQFIYSRKLVKKLRSKRALFRLGLEIKANENSLKTIIKNEEEIELFGEWQCIP